MRKLWTWIPLILCLSACGNPSQFRAKNVELERVDVASPGKPRADGPVDQIVRHSGNIQYQDLQAEWDGDKITLKGNLKLGKRNFGAVEMHGERDGEEIVFSTDHKDLEGKMKAKATCISDDGVCSNFFIDILIREDSGLIQHDQFVVKATTKIVATPKPPVTATTTTLKTETIDDEVEDSKQGTYVGLSDDEVHDLFKPKPLVTTSTTTTTSSTTSTSSSTTTTSVSTTTTTVKNNPPGPTTTTVSTTTTTTSSTTTTSLKLISVSKEQAIGKPSEGRLQNAVDLSLLASAKDSFFALIWPQNTTHFGTTSMAELIHKLAAFVHSKVPGYIFKVGTVSNERGGYVSPHASHQNGLDADLGYIVSNSRSEFNRLVSRQGLSADYMASENWELFKKAFSLGQVQLIFVHPQIKQALCAEALRVGDLKNAEDRGSAYEILRRVKVDKYVEKAKGLHDNHFHLRISCPRTDKRCLQPQYTLEDSGCF